MRIAFTHEIRSTGMFFAFIACSLALRLCDVGIPCQDVDIGTVTGSFDTAAALQQYGAFRVFLSTIVDSRNVDLVGHFVDHYNKAGVVREHMLFMLHGASRDAQYQRAFNALNVLNVSVVQWIGPFSATAALYQRLVLLKNITSADWLLYADMDEFAAFNTPVYALVNSLRNANYTVVRGQLVDRVAKSGILPDVAPLPAIAVQFPLVCSLTRTVLRGSTSKIVLVNGSIRASAGQHAILEETWYKKNLMRMPATVARRPHPTTMSINHYKWTSGVIALLTKRVAYYRDVMRANWWRESEAFLKLVNATGRIPVDQYCTDSSAADKKPSPAAALSKEWLSLNQSSLPICRLPSGTCATTQYHLRPSACGNEIGVFDRGFANAVLQVVGARSLVEIHATHGCYSHYWATAGRLPRFNATQPERRNGTPFAVLPVGNEERFGASVDWVLSTTYACSQTPCRSLDAIARLALYGVIATPDTNDSCASMSKTALDAAQATLEQSMRRLGFVMHSESTETLRTATTDARLRCSVTAFYKSQLLLKRLPTDFLALKMSNTAWNNAISFAGVWYRVYSPPTLIAPRSTLVIGVLSVANNVDTRRAIRETWAIRARSLSCSVVFLLAEPTPAVFVEAAQHGDMVLIEARDIYSGYNSSLPLKTYAFMQLVVRYATSAQWVFKCDDDTFLFPERLQAILAAYGSPETIRHYVGSAYYIEPTRIVRHTRFYIGYDLYPATMFPPFMSGGAGYALSIAAVRCLASHTQSASYMYFPLEDVSVGLALREACYPFKIANRGDVFSGSKPKVPKANQVTMHYVRGVQTVYNFWHPQMKT